MQASGRGSADLQGLFQISLGTWNGTSVEMWKHVPRSAFPTQTLHPVANDPLEHSCVRPTPCPPRRGHCVDEREGTRLGPGWLSQQDSSWLPVRGSSPSSLIPRATPPRLCWLPRSLAFCTLRRTELWDLACPLSRLSGGSGADLNT